MIIWLYKTDQCCTNLLLRKSVSVKETFFFLFILFLNLENIFVIDIYKDKGAFRNHG